MDDGLTFLIFVAMAGSAVAYVVVDRIGEDQAGCCWTFFAIAGFGLTGLIAPTLLGTCSNEPCEFRRSATDPSSLYRTELPSMVALIVVGASVLILLVVLAGIGSEASLFVALLWAGGFLIQARLAFSGDFPDRLIFAGLGVLMAIALVVSQSAIRRLRQRWDLVE